MRNYKLIKEEIETAKAVLKKRGYKTPAVVTAVKIGRKEIYGFFFFDKEKIGDIIENSDGSKSQVVAIVRPELETVKDVELFIINLNNNGTLYHFDDDAHDIINCHTRQSLFSAQEADEMNLIVDKARQICDAANVDIFDLVMKLTMEGGCDE